MFIERLNQLLKERHLTKKQFLIDNKMGKNQFHHWQTGTLPNPSTVKAIAGYFGVSEAYLLGDSDDPSPVRGAVRSTPEEHLLDAFHQLNDDGIELAIDYVDGLAVKARYQKAGTRRIRPGTVVVKAAGPKARRVRVNASKASGDFRTFTVGAKKK